VLRTLERIWRGKNLGIYGIWGGLGMVRLLHEEVRGVVREQLVEWESFVVRGLEHGWVWDHGVEWVRECLQALEWG